MKGRVYPNKGAFIVRFGNVSKYCRTKDEANRMLTGMRWESYRGTYDPRDYGPGKPLAFDKLADKYLIYKIFFSCSHCFSTFTASSLRSISF